MAKTESNYLIGFSVSSFMQLVRTLEHTYVREYFVYVPLRHHHTSISFSSLLPLFFHFSLPIILGIAETQKREKRVCKKYRMMRKKK